MRKTRRNAALTARETPFVPIEKYLPDRYGYAAALANAINEAAAIGGVVTHQPGKTYTVSSALTVTDKDVRIDFNGATLSRPTTPTDFTPLTFAYSHSTPQSVVGVSTVALNQPWPWASDAYVDRIEVASTAGWSAGDYAVVVADDAIIGANPSRATQREGDRVRIIKVESTYLYTARPLRGTYTTGIRVARMTQKDCVLKNVRITDAPGWSNTRNDGFLVVSGAVKPRVEGFSSFDLATRAIEFRGCAQGVVDSLDMTNNRTDGVIDAHGYGVALISCCDFTLRHLEGEFGRHVVTTGARAAVTAGDAELTRFGSNWGHRYVGGTAHGMGNAAFDFHEEAAYCTIDGCYVGWNRKEPEGSSAAFNLRGRYNELINSRSIGGGGLRASSYGTGGGHFRVHNWVHTTIPGIVSTVGYGIYVDGSNATERCVVDVSGVELNMPDYLSRPVYLNKASMRGSDLTINANTPSAGTNYLIELHDSDVDLDTLVVDITGSTGSTVHVFRVMDDISSVNVNNVIVRAGDASWSLGSMNSANGTLKVGRYSADTAPMNALFASVGASAAVSVGGNALVGGVLLDNGYRELGNGDATMYMSSVGFQRFTSPLTTNRTVTEYATPRRQPGYAVTYIRDTAATGAYSITIGDDTLATAGTWLRRMWTGSAWVTIAKGTLTGQPTNGDKGDITVSSSGAVWTLDDGVVDVANFQASAIVTESERISLNDNDTTIPTSAAVNDRVQQSSQLWVPKAYVSGQYYLTHPNQAGGSTSATLAFGTVRTLPWLVSEPITLAALLVEFTAAGDADSMYHVGIWNDDGYGRPGTLLADVGSLSTGTGNAGTVATGGTPNAYDIPISTTIPAGLYHLGGVVQGATATTQPTMRIPSSITGQHSGPLGSSASGLAASTIGAGWTKTGFGTGALTDISSPSKNSSASTIPARILAKAA